MRFVIHVFGFKNKKLKIKTRFGGVLFMWIWRERKDWFGY